MIWIIVFLVIALAGGLVGFLFTNENEDAVFDALGTAIRWGYVIFQVSLVLIGLAVLIFVGSWLIG